MVRPSGETTGASGTAADTTAGETDGTTGGTGEPPPAAWGERYCPRGPFGEPFAGETLVVSEILVPDTPLDPRNFEGPVWIEAQSMFLFCDRPPGGSPDVGDPTVYWIHQLTPGGDSSTFAASVPCGGLALVPDDSAVIVAQGRGSPMGQLSRQLLNAQSI